MQQVLWDDSQPMVDVKQSSALSLTDVRNVVQVWHRLF